MGQAWTRATPSAGVRSSGPAWRPPSSAARVAAGLATRPAAAAAAAKVPLVDAATFGAFADKEPFPSLQSHYALEALVGPLPTMSWFSTWSIGLPQVAAEAGAKGYDLQIAWQPILDRGAPIMFADILAGRWDTYIRSYFQSLARYPGRVTVRFAHEPNGTRFPWSQGNASRACTSPKQYVDTWNHLRAIKVAAGGANTGSPGACPARTPAASRSRRSGRAALPWTSPRSPPAATLMARRWFQVSTYCFGDVHARLAFPCDQGKRVPVRLVREAHGRAARVAGQRLEVRADVRVPPAREDVGEHDRRATVEDRLPGDLQVVALGARLRGDLRQPDGPGREPRHRRQWADKSLERVVGLQAGERLLVGEGPEGRRVDERAPWQRRRPPPAGSRGLPRPRCRRGRRPPGRSGGTTRLRGLLVSILAIDSGA